MYFIMISQQNCNLQQAMSYLLRAREGVREKEREKARAFSLLVSLFLPLSALFPSLFSAACPPPFPASFSVPLLAGLVERAVRFSEELAIKMKREFNVEATARLDTRATFRHHISSSKSFVIPPSPRLLLFLHTRHVNAFLYP